MAQGGPIAEALPVSPMKVNLPSSAVPLRTPGAEEEAGAELPSAGSAPHASGGCQPCAWFWRAGGCTNGYACNHCHLCPEDEVKIRKKKKKVLMKLGLGGEAASAEVAAEAAAMAEEPWKVSVPGTLNLVDGYEEGMLLGSPAPASFWNEAAWSMAWGPPGEQELEAESVAAASAAALVLFSTGLLLPPGQLHAEQPEVASGAEAAVPSLGSALHASGTCRPCAWFWRAGGCQNAQECLHCHLCSEGVLKARKKEKRTMLRLGLATPRPGASQAEEGGVAQELTFGDLGLPPLHTPRSKAPAAEGDPPGSAGTEGSTTTASSGSDLEATESALGSPAPAGHLSGSDEDVGRGPVATSRSGTKVRLPPGLQAPVGSPSHGSALHKVDNCWPCARFWRPEGCQEGRACGYCHLCPMSEVQGRKRSKRTMLRLGLATPKAMLVEEEALDFQLE